MSTPTVHGYELSPGDDLGLDTIPVCHDDDMNPRGNDGSREYTCRSCTTVLAVSANGLVSDITD